MALVTVPRLRLQHPSPDVMLFFPPLPAIMGPQPARSKACFAVQVGIVCVCVRVLYKLSSRSEAVKSRLAEWNMGMGERQKSHLHSPSSPPLSSSFFRQRSGLIAFQVRRSLAGRHGSWPSRWMRQGGRIARKRECALPRRYSVHNDNRARALEPVGAMIPR